MNLTPIIDRIRDEVPALKLVGGAAQFERALGGLTALPAAFILPAAEAAEPSPFMDQLVQQQVGAEFSVLVAARNLADDEGAAAVEALEPVRVAIRAALLGWPPTDEHDSCEFRAGELVAFDNGVLWWQDRYSTAFLIRSV